jgi:hypothetical protein
MRVARQRQPRGVRKRGGVVRAKQERRRVRVRAWPKDARPSAQASSVSAAPACNERRREARQQSRGLPRRDEHGPNRRASGVVQDSSELSSTAGPQNATACTRRRTCGADGSVRAFVAVRAIRQRAGAAGAAP